MFGKSKAPASSVNVAASEQKFNSAKIDTLIGKGTTIDGDVRFSGGLHVEGMIKGNLSAEDNDAVLVLSENGHIQGEVRVGNMVLNGSIDGDVFAVGRLELAQQARICGDVYYNLLEMAVGSEVNGRLVRQKEGNFLQAPKDSEAEIVQAEPEN